MALNLDHHRRADALTTALAREGLPLASGLDAGVLKRSRPGVSWHDLGQRGMPDHIVRPSGALPKDACVGPAQVHSSDTAGAV